MKGKLTAGKLTLFFFFLFFFIYLNYILLSGNVSALIVQGIEIWSGGEIDFPYLFKTFPVFRILIFSLLILILSLMLLKFLRDLKWSKNFDIRAFKISDILLSPSHTIMRKKDFFDAKRVCEKLQLFLKDQKYKTTWVNYEDSYFVEGRKESMHAYVSLFTRIIIFLIFLSFTMSIWKRKSLDLPLTEGEENINSSYFSLSRYNWPPLRAEDMDEEMVRRILNFRIKVERVILSNPFIPAGKPEKLSAWNLFALIRVEPEGMIKTVKFFPPVHLENAIFMNLTGFDIAPCFEIRREESIIFNGCVKMNLLPPGKEDVFFLENFPLRIFFRLSGEDENIDVFHPRFSLILEVEGKKETHTVNAGERLMTEGFSFTLYPSRFWITITFSKDTGIEMFSSLIKILPLAIILNFSTLLFFKRKRARCIIAREKDGTAVYLEGSKKLLKYIIEKKEMLFSHSPEAR